MCYINTLLYNTTLAMMMYVSQFETSNNLSYYF